MCIRDSIYDLGLIYELVINKNHEAFIKMTFTAPNCPMADEGLDEVQKNVTDVPGIKACNVELVFDPAWDQSMLSDEARLELGLATSSGTSSGKCLLAYVPGRSEYLNIKAAS